MFHLKTEAIAILFIFVSMNALKRLFDIYLQGSMHVALAVAALVLMTNHMFKIPLNWAMLIFAYCGTMFSYNFMKYESLYRFKKTISRRIKLITVLSTIAFAVATASFFFLEKTTRITAVIFFGLTALYTVPIFPKQANLRNLSGIKVYIVAFCWAGVTTLLPLINAGMDISMDVILKFCQRFLLVLILILVFEIIDLSEDDPMLRTVPQIIGVKMTKWLNILLLLPFYFLEFFKSVVDPKQLIVNIILVIGLVLFTFFATPQRSKYYTLFWVESVPIFWLGMVVLVSHL